MGTEAVVLVVEDDALVGEFFNRALRRAGLTAVVARTAAAALHEAAEHHFTAAVVDGILPDMHGLDLIRHLLDGGLADVPICVISGALNHDIPPQAGIAALAKPVGPAKLAATISCLLEWRDNDCGRGGAGARHAALGHLAELFTVKPS